MALVDQILDFTIIEKGDVELSEVPFELDVVVRNAMEEWRPQAAAKGLELCMELRTVLPGPVVGDPKRLGQVVAALVDNAVRFTDSNEVVVQLAFHGATGGATQARIEVIDTGIGIAEHRLQQIFEGFTQVDSSSTRRHEGLGLGLAMTRKLLHQMGASSRCAARSARGVRSGSWSRSAPPAPDIPIGRAAPSTSRSLLAGGQGSISSVPSGPPLAEVNLEIQPRLATESIAGRRPYQEDAVLAQALSDGRIVVAVADGMGGHAAGDVASALAMETLVQALEDGQALGDAFTLANSRVHSKSREPGKQGMGSTMVAAVIDGATFTVANVGDSRCYLLGADGIKQISEDHSFVAEAMKRGQSEEEALSSRFKDVLTRSIGIDEQVKADTFGPYPVENNTALFLCSDGLYKVMTNARIRELFGRSGGPRGAAQSMVATAYEDGSDDNISIALAEFGEVKRDRAMDTMPIEFVPPPADDTADDAADAGADDAVPIVAAAPAAVEADDDTWNEDWDSSTTVTSRGGRNTMLIVVGVGVIGVVLTLLFLMAA